MLHWYVPWMLLELGVHVFHTDLGWQDLTIHREALRNIVQNIGVWLLKTLNSQCCWVIHFMRAWANIYTQVL